MRQPQVQSGMIVGLFLLVAMTGTGRAEQGFDEKYQRDFNIFNPINAYDPTNPFNPINRFDPGNPVNHINQFNLNNPFNPVNRWVEWEQMACGLCRWRGTDSRFWAVQLTFDVGYINLMPGI